MPGRLYRQATAGPPGTLERDARLRMWRPGPVQRQPVNRVRAGRQQLSAEPAVCRRSPGRALRWRAQSARRSRLGGRAVRRDARADESARLESVCGATHRGFESHSLRGRYFARLRALASLADPSSLGSERSLRSLSPPSVGSSLALPSPTSCELRPCSLALDPRPHFVTFSAPRMMEAASRSAAICADRLAIAMNIASPRVGAARPSSMRRRP